MIECVTSTSMVYPKLYVHRIEAKKIDLRSNASLGFVKVRSNKSSETLPVNQNSRHQDDYFSMLQNCATSISSIAGILFLINNSSRKKFCIQPY